MAKTDENPREREDPRKMSAEERRAGRQDVGGHNYKLSANIPAGYAGRWVNHSGDAIGQRRNSGWVHALKDGGIGEDISVSGGDEADMGQAISKRVDVIQGVPIFAYLMLIRQEWLYLHF